MSNISHKNIKLVSLTNKQLGSIYLFPNNFIKESKPYHIYIVSNKKIKEGDWYFSDIHQLPFKCLDKKQYFDKSNDKKVELTTDESLLDLPKLSIKDTKKYIDIYNKHKEPSIADLLNILFRKPNFKYFNGAGEVYGTQILTISNILSYQQKDDFLLFDNLGGKKFDIIVNSKEYPKAVISVKDQLKKEHPGWLLAYQIDGKEFILKEFKTYILNHK